WAPDLKFLTRRYHSRGFANGGNAAAGTVLSSGLSLGQVLLDYHLVSEFHPPLPPFHPSASLRIRDTRLAFRSSRTGAGAAVQSAPGAARFDRIGAAAARFGPGFAGWTLLRRKRFP